MKATTYSYRGVTPAVEHPLHQMLRRKQAQWDGEAQWEAYAQEQEAYIEELRYDNEERARNGLIGEVDAYRYDKEEGSWYESESYTNDLPLSRFEIFLQGFDRKRDLAIEHAEHVKRQTTHDNNLPF